MKKIFFTVIILTLIGCCFGELEAANQPSILGLYLGMSRKNAGCIVDAICKNHNMRLIELTSTLQLVPPTDEKMYEYSRNPFSEPLYTDTNILPVKMPDPIASHSYKMCRTLANNQLRRIKPTQSFALFDGWGHGMILLGFNQYELIEIMVAPRLFNLDKYGIDEVINMLQRQWKINFLQERNYNNVTCYKIVRKNILIYINSSRQIYLNKLQSKNSSAPTMSLSSNQEQYYFCECAESQSIRGSQIINSGSSSNSQSGFNAPSFVTPLSSSPSGGYSTPKVNYKRTCSKPGHGTYDIRFGGCPACKAPKFGL